MNKERTGKTHIASIPDENQKYSHRLWGHEKGTKGTLQAELQQSFRTYIKWTSFLKEQNPHKCTNTEILNWFLNLIPSKNKPNQDGFSGEFYLQLKEKNTEHSSNHLPL